MDTQNRAARKQYHVIYKTTCLITNKYYIGMHSTDNLDDGYLGSGKRLWQSIKKHGLENHKCEILEHLPTREVLRAREAELVNVKLLFEENCMNIALGGGGGWELANKSITRESRILWGIKGRKIISELGINYKFSQNDIKNGHATQRLLNKGIFSKDIQKLGQIAAASSEVNNKRKSTFEKIQHSLGSKNPMYGKCWINKDNNSKPVYKHQLLDYFKEGWNLGRICKSPISSVVEQPPCKR